MASHRELRRMKSSESLTTTKLPTNMGLSLTIAPRGRFSDSQSKISIPDSPILPTQGITTDGGQNAHKRVNRKACIVDGIVHIPSSALQKEPVPDFPQARITRGRKVKRNQRPTQRLSTNSLSRKSSWITRLARCLLRDFFRLSRKTNRTSNSRKRSSRNSLTSSMSEFPQLKSDLAKKSAPLDPKKLAIGINPLRSHSISSVLITITPPESEEEAPLPVSSSHQEPAQNLRRSCHLTESHAWQKSYERAHKRNVYLQNQIQETERITANKERAAQTQRAATLEAWNKALDAERKKVSSLEQQVKDLRAHVAELEQTKPSLTTSGTQTEDIFFPSTPPPESEPTQELQQRQSTDSVRLFRYFAEDRTAGAQIDELFLPLQPQFRRSRIPRPIRYEVRSPASWQETLRPQREQLEQSQRTSEILRISRQSLKISPVPHSSDSHLELEVEEIISTPGDLSDLSLDFISHFNDGNEEEEEGIPHLTHSRSSSPPPSSPHTPTQTLQDEDFTSLTTLRLDSDSRITRTPLIFRKSLSSGNEELKEVAHAIGMGSWEWCSIPDLRVNEFLSQLSG